MATSDDHNSLYLGQRRAEAPLPPLPSSASSHANYQQQSFSPVSSSSDNPVYRPVGRRSDQSLGLNHEYYGSGGETPFQNPNHYSDDIPLRHYQPNGDSASSSPHDLRHDSTNVHNVQTREHRQDRTRRKKHGFFSKKTPWAVYFFTLLQIVVFVAELVKNGKEMIRVLLNWV